MRPIEKTLNNIKKRNKDLVAKYPFLAPKEYDFNHYDETGEDRYFIPDDYDYTWTYLDEMPHGWRVAFGEDMCKELYDELVKHNYLDGYVINQVKEKYGQLRVYDNGVPQGAGSVWDVIDKYTAISERTCCNCGKPATKISRGWVCPWCDECAKEIGGEFVDIGDDFNDDEIMALPKTE